MIYLCFYSDNGSLFYLFAYCVNYLHVTWTIYPISWKARCQDVTNCTDTLLTGKKPHFALILHDRPTRFLQGFMVVFIVSSSLLGLSQSNSNSHSPLVFIYHTFTVCDLLFKILTGIIVRFYLFILWTLLNWLLWDRA